MRKYPPTNKIRSADEMQRLYLQAVKEVESLRKTTNYTNITARQYKHDRDDAREEATRYKKKTVTLTKAQKARDEANACGMWSGGACITVTIIYEICAISGYWIGGSEWEAFWRHQAIHSTVLWVCTVFFAEVFKATRR
jgi:hypothetical protein